MSPMHNHNEVLIFDLSGEPFSHFEHAAKMRDLLAAENPGNQYSIELYSVSDDQQGFVVKRRNGNTEKKTETRQATPSHDIHQAPDNKIEFTPHVYHPALRAYLLYLPPILICVWLLLFTADAWVGLLNSLGISSLPPGIDARTLVSGTQLIAGTLLVWLVLTVLINYYGTALIVDDRGITLKKGILTRDETNVRFTEIRTIGLRQSILDRLMNIGILEFASSGTDDIDIRFFNIVNPTRVKTEIEAIIQQYRN